LFKKFDLTGDNYAITPDSPLLQVLKNTAVFKDVQPWSEVLKCFYPQVAINIGSSWLFTIDDYTVVVPNESYVEELQKRRVHTVLAEVKMFFDIKGVKTKLYTPATNCSDISLRIEEYFINFQDILSIFIDFEEYLNQIKKKTEEEIQNQIEIDLQIK
jgi:hypothetical protein